MPLLLGLTLALTAWNLVLNLAGVPAWAYVPANLAASVGLLVVARLAGLGWPEVGLGPEGVGPGLRWGLAIVAVIGAGLGLALVLPPAQPFLEDARVAGIGVSELLYRTLVRIPLGTVLLEELAFRGVLLAAALRVMGTGAAVAWSSAVFGLWHVGPMIGLLEANDLMGNPAVVVGGVVGGVVLTGVAGAGFCWLRLRTRGVVGPVVVHTGLNSLATVAAYIAQR